MNELRCSPSSRVSRDYPIYIGTGILSQLIKVIDSYDPDKVIIIADLTCEKLYGQEVKSVLNQYDTSLISIPVGETSKTPETYLDLCNRILEKKVTKKSFILLLGGGVCGNLGGFAASTIMRGLRFGHLPTTIISQADSTTGGKQGINTWHGKNLLGLFNDPEFVLIDTDFIKTLPPREVKGGLAECIKHALCHSQDFVNYLHESLNKDAMYSHDVLRGIITRTLSAKLEVLRYDPKEINEGKVLVYGHTVGHAIETISEGKLTHGEAISIGMMFTAYASLELGLCGEDLVDEHSKLFLKAGLPTVFPKYVTESKLMEQLRYDKKYSAGMELVLLEGLGKLHSREGRIGFPVTEEFVRGIYRKYFQSK